MRALPDDNDASGTLRTVEPLAAAGVRSMGAGAKTHRAMRILLAFSRERHTLSSRELSALTGIPLPSIYRYVSMLRHDGLLVRDEGGDYHLSARFIGLAEAAIAGDRLAEIAHPMMHRLAADTGETILLVRLLSGAAVCVHRIESLHPLRISYEPGQPLSLDRGATGRLFLGSMSAARRRDYLAPLYERDPRRAQLVETEARLARKRGWATSTEELDRGVWAAAAAVYASGRTVAVLSMPSPLVRAEESLQDRLLDQVRHAAGEITSALTRA